MARGVSGSGGTAGGKKVAGFLTLVLGGAAALGCGEQHGTLTPVSGSEGSAPPAANQETEAPSRLVREPTVAKPSVSDRAMAIVRERSRRPGAELTHATRFREDLGLDSLDVVEIVLEVEDEFNLRISDSSAELMKTVGDLVTYLESRG